MCRAKYTVRKVKQGDKFYTYEVQEMELIEERGADPNREGETPHNGNTSNNSITGTNVYSAISNGTRNEMPFFIILYRLGYSRCLNDCQLRCGMSLHAASAIASPRGKNM